MSIVIELLAVGGLVWMPACLLDGGPSLGEIAQVRLGLLAFAGFGIGLGTCASALWRGSGAALGACLTVLVGMAATPPLLIAPVIAVAGARSELIQLSLLLNPWVFPTLTLAYLPHLDYNLQRLGPRHPQIAKDLRAIDAVCGELIAQLRDDGARVVVLSEYAITEVSGPVHINRALREARLIQVRTELGLDLLDAGASEAFAVADHQIAHVYVRRPERIPEVKRLIESLPGVEAALDEDGKRAHGLGHARSGELVAIAGADRWFTYYYWLDDRVAPDFARTVDIHRKPGYDPVELFLDPALRAPRLKVGSILLRKALGFRYLMDVIPLDATLLKGSHGRLTEDPKAGPLLISSEPSLLPESVHAAGVKQLVLDHVFAG